MAQKLTKGQERFLKKLDLSGLTEPEFDPEEIRRTNEAIEKEQAEYQKKYGDDWFQKWWSDKCPEPDYDTDMETVNAAVYFGYFEGGYNKRSLRLQPKYERRMHELYGADYDRLEHHAKGDPEVVELLLQDMLKTGKWKEFPECLYPEYCKRAKNSITSDEKEKIMDAFKLWEERMKRWESMR